MENKNVYMTSHGSRIRDSFFKLEPNVRVYMNCSDTLTYVGNIGILLILKNNLTKKNEIINYVKLQKIFNNFLKLFKSEAINTERLLSEIREKMNENLRKIKNKLNEVDNMIDKNIDKIKKKLEVKVLDKKVENELKNREKKLLFMKNMINKYMNGDREKLKFINKNLYENVKKYEKMYKKYEKSKKYMDYAYHHQFGFRKKNNERIYLNAFNMCVYSGNLDNNIKKYMLSYGLLDLNICPNLYFSGDYKNDFKAYISELPIKMEIRKNNEVIANSDDIKKMLNKFFQKTLEYKEVGKFYQKDNYYYLSTTNNIYKNRNLIILYKNVITEYKEKMDLEIGELTNMSRTTSELYYKNLKLVNTLSGEEKVKKLIFVKKLYLKIKEIERMIKNVYNKYKMLTKNKYEIYINKSKNELFYPFIKMDDCNIKETLGNVVNNYRPIYKRL